MPEDETRYIREEELDPDPMIQFGRYFAEVCACARHRRRSQAILRRILGLICLRPQHSLATHIACPITPTPARTAGASGAAHHDSRHMLGKRPPFSTHGRSQRMSLPSLSPHCGLVGMGPPAFQPLTCV